MNNSMHPTPTHNQPLARYQGSLRWHDYRCHVHPKGLPPINHLAINHSAHQPPSRRVGVTKNGVVVVDRFKSHSHLDPALLAEALGRVEMPAVAFAKLTVPMGRTIGVSSCVETTASDLVVFAQRPGRQGLTRFVKNRAPTPCSNIIVILKAARPGKCVLITAFIGDHAEPEPWDQKATHQSCEFWEHHALIWGSEPVVPGTTISPKRKP